MRAEDEQLLDQIAALYGATDPPPVDLAEGVLARIEAEELDAELLTLVELDPELAGVRSAAVTRVPDEVGSWSLEYLGPGFRVQLRVARGRDQARLDGWVVPAQSMTVRLTAVGTREGTVEAVVSESGRFEFPLTPTGACRLTFLPTTANARPLVTPPFWI